MKPRLPKKRPAKTFKETLRKWKIVWELLTIITTLEGVVSFVDSVLTWLSPVHTSIISPTSTPISSPTTIFTTIFANTSTTFAQTTPVTYFFPYYPNYPVHYVHAVAVIPYQLSFPLALLFGILWFKARRTRKE